MIRFSPVLEEGYVIIKTNGFLHEMCIDYHDGDEYIWTDRDGWDPLSYFFGGLYD